MTSIIHSRSICSVKMYAVQPDYVITNVYILFHSHARDQSFFSFRHQTLSVRSMCPLSVPVRYRSTWCCP